MKSKVKIKEQYGIVNKKVINNNRLSINAKGLYTYLCARSGSKGECYPLVNTICNDLGINEATFHKAKNELLKNNIIKINKNGEGLKKRNTYILIENQSKENYGIVYLRILTNPSISLKAKAIYGLLSCLSGTRFVAYPTAKAVYTTLKICRNTYFSCLKKLKEYEYLMTKQLHINGRYSYCNFYINGKKPNKPENRYIFKGLKNEKGLLKNIKETLEYKNYEKVISSNIEYETLKGIYSDNNKAISVLETTFSVLVSNIYSKDTRGIRYKGNVFSSSIVKSIFSKLNFDNIKCVVDSVLKVDNKINNIRNYIRVALFNSYYEVKQKQYKQYQK